MDQEQLLVRSITCQEARQQMEVKVTSIKHLVTSHTLETISITVQPWAICPMFLKHIKLLMMDIKTSMLELVMIRILGLEKIQTYLRLDTPCQALLWSYQVRIHLKLHMHHILV